MKTLVVAPAWVGDMVMAQSLIALLSAGGKEIQVLAPPSTAPLAERMPGVARVHLLPVGHGALKLATRRRVGRRLADERFADAIVLPNSWKAALVPWFARIPTRTGWRGEWRYGLLNDQRVLDVARHPKLVQRYLALGLPQGTALPDRPPLPRLLADTRRGAELRVQLGLNAAPRVLGLCPGAEYGPAKRWPVRHFAAVAEHQVQKGGSVWLLGSARDAEMTAEIVRALRPGARDAVVDLAGRTTLTDVVDLLAAVDAVVTNDSGLMHVACALGRRVVAVYGSTSPVFTPPLADSATVVYRPPPCSPCFARVCPLGHMRCLEELDPQEVIGALERSGAP